MAYQTANPGAMANVDNTGGSTWTALSAPIIANCGLDDGTSFADHSDYLDLTGFGFSVPTGATITGIRLYLVRSREDTPPSVSTVTDTVVQLLRAGTPDGDNKAAYSWPSSAVAAGVYYGGDGDLWGETWAPVDVNDADFGVRIAVQSDGADVTSPAVRTATALVVWYTESGGGATLHRRRVVWI